MVSTNDDVITSASTSQNNESLPQKINRSIQQASSKRRFLDTDDQDDDQNYSNKRECSTTTKTTISCPVSNFGCIKEISPGNLIEHYATQTHQKALMKAIEDFVRNLHNQPFIDQSENESNKQDTEQIADSVSLLGEGLSCLQDDSVSIHTNMLQMNRVIRDLQNDVDMLKKSTEEASKSLDAAQTNNSKLQTEVEYIKQTIADAPHVPSDNGSYIWKITDVSKKMENARTDRQTSIYSPPFYSSQTGYKMCMRLYLNGDGQVRRTHMSLFFVLMRGAYDPILAWPFQYKVTFCLYDLSGSGKHVIDSFRPDTKSNSFQRPRSDMNIASGIPKFLPLPFIQPDRNSYIRDDAMFIQCTIDFASAQKISPQFIMNITPALPSAIQHDVIQAEIQKQNVSSDTSNEIKEIKNEQ